MYLVLTMNDNWIYNYLCNQCLLPVVSSNPVHGEVYYTQHYVIKFVSDLPTLGFICNSSSSAVDRDFESYSRRAIDYEKGICWLSAKHTALRSKNKDWFVQNEDTVSILNYVIKFVSDLPTLGFICYR
jgi:hypothetical protein